MTLTQPDIAFSVNKACQLMATPLESHSGAVKRIMCYLSGTTTHGLLLSLTNHLLNFSLYAYRNSDRTNNMDDLRFTLGSCVFFCPNLVAWKSKKQVLVARSSMEAKYRALTQTTTELLWLKSLISELHIEYLLQILLCDNVSAVLL